MQKIVCLAVGVALLCVGYVQAEEMPFVELKGHMGAVNSAVFSSDGRKIVTASQDRTTRIWDAETRRELLTLNTGDLYAAFSPDGAKVITAGSYDYVAIWDANSGKRLRKLARRKSLGERIVRSFVSMAEFGKSAAFSSDGKKIVTGGNNIIIIWDAESGKELLAISDVAGTCIVNFSPDGTKVVSAGHGIRNKTARIWDAVSGKEERRLVGHTDKVESAVFSPDGKKIATASNDNTARIWDAESGKELLKLEHSWHVISATFSSDGKKVVTTVGGNIFIWDAETGRELRKLEGHTNSIRAATFSPDGKRLVTGGFPDGTARIWTLEP